MSQDKRVAIVTAASQGIGAACARHLHANGYDISLLSRRGAEALARELGALDVHGSVTNTADLETLVERTLAEHGRIDVVVNNTGHPPKGPLLELTDDDWHAGLDLVLLNVVRTSRLVTPVMRAQGGGAIVNISTFAAFEPDARFPISSALRAALAGYVKMYSDEHAQHGIRMNNVLPGFVDSYPEDAEVAATIPARRYGRVEEIAEAVGFLASASGSYVTGQNLRVDGGLTRSV